MVGQERLVITWNLTFAEGLLLRGCRLIILAKLRDDVIITFTVAIKELWSATGERSHTSGGRESTMISRIMSSSVMFVRRKEFSPESLSLSPTGASLAEIRQRPVLLARTNVARWLLSHVRRTCSSKERYECVGGDRSSQANFRSTWEPRQAGFKQRTTIFRLCFPHVSLVLRFSSHDQQTQVLSEQRRIGRPDY